MALPAFSFPSALPIPEALSANLASITDVRGLFALLIGIIIFLYGISVGKSRAILSLLSIYVAYALTVLFPFRMQAEQFVAPESRPLIPTGVFIVSYLFVFGVLNLSVLRKRLSLGEISIPKVLVISAIQVGLLASMVASLLPAEVTDRFGMFKPYITGGPILFGWTVFAVLVLPFMREKRRSYQ
jgi:hypothetical protein